MVMSALPGPACLALLWVERTAALIRADALIAAWSAVGVAEQRFDGDTFEVNGRHPVYLHTATQDSYQHHE
jgi:hypothetical protein